MRGKHQMKLKNPIPIGMDLSLILRDSRGRFASPSRAKFFELYYKDELVLADEFPRVNLSVKLKEEIVDAYIPIAQEIGMRYVLPKKQKIVEPEPEPEKPAIPQGDFYEWIPIQYDQRGEPYSIESIAFDSKAFLHKMEFVLDDPFMLERGDVEGFDYHFNNTIWPVFKGMFKTSIPGERWYIPAVIFDQPYKNGEVFEKRDPVTGRLLRIHKFSHGFAINRFQAETLDEFFRAIKEFYQYFRERYKKYLEFSNKEDMKVVSITLENMFAMEHP